MIGWRLMKQSDGTEKLTLAAAIPAKVAALAPSEDQLKAANDLITAMIMPEYLSLVMN
jgi:hypothetical protein